MVITRAEKIWLAIVVILYICYNIPGLPGYHQPIATIVHGIITVGGIWTAIYIGMRKVYKIQSLNPEEEEGTEEQTKEEGDETC